MFQVLAGLSNLYLYSTCYSTLGKACFVGAYAVQRPYETDSNNICHTGDNLAYLTGSE